MARAVERGSRVVEVDAVERGREAVRVALAPDLAVADDIEAGLLLGADRDDRRVVLGLVEQNVAMAMTVADRAYVLEEGRIVGEGEPQALLARPEIQRAYLGV